MPDGLLGVLKVCLLAVVYLFFLRVLWAVGMELRSTAPAPASAPPANQHLKRRPAPPRRRRGKDAPPTMLVVAAGPGAGATHPLDGELTIGRAPGCAIALEDGFASQLHARVYGDGERAFVEDLGSTNGTFVNGERLVTPTLLRRGDAIVIGETVLEAR